jgi:hypothetical protein
MSSSCEGLRLRAFPWRRAGEERLVEGLLAGRRGRDRLRSKVASLHATALGPGRRSQPVSLRDNVPQAMRHSDTYGMSSLFAVVVVVVVVARSLARPSEGRESVGRRRVERVPAGRAELSSLLLPPSLRTARPRPAWDRRLARHPLPDAGPPSPRHAPVQCPSLRCASPRSAACKRRGDSAPRGRPSPSRSRDHSEPPPRPTTGARPGVCCFPAGPLAQRRAASACPIDRPAIHARALIDRRPRQLKSNPVVLC